MNSSSCQKPLLANSPEVKNFPPLPVSLSRVLLRVRMLYYLRQEVIGDQAEKILEGADSRWVRACVLLAVTIQAVGVHIKGGGHASNLLHAQRISLSASQMQCLSYQPGDVTRIGRSLFVGLCGRTKRCELNDSCSEVTFKTGSCAIEFTPGPGRRRPTSALPCSLGSHRPSTPTPLHDAQVLVVGRGRVSYSSLSILFQQWGLL